MSRLDQVIDQMQAYGLPQLPQGHPVLDGKIHRFGAKSKSWYALREYRLQSGEYVVAGGFGFWQGENNNAVSVKIDWEGISDQERQEIERKQRDFEEKEKARRQKQAAFAAGRAQTQWSDAAWINQSDIACPYLDRKKIPRKWGRITADGTLLIPLMRPTLDAGDLVGVQKIGADGGKLFNKGMNKVGAACLLTDFSADSRLVMIGEGFATVASVVEATSEIHTAFVALDVGNLLPVARVVREICPDAHILFLADDDWMIDARLMEWRSNNPQDQDSPAVNMVDEFGDRFIQVESVSGRTVTFRNAGIRGAKTAARTLGNASVVWPVFSDRAQNKWTDFNDLHVHESLEAVRQQVEEAVRRTEPVGDPPDSVVQFPTLQTKPKGAASKKTGEEEKKEAKKGRPKKVYPQAFWDTVNYLLDNFTLIYGDDVAWDAQNRILIQIKNMRIAFGTDAVKFWLGNSDRRMINKKNLVFDPTLDVVPDDMVNLFDGFKMQPRKGGCEMIIQLLSHLCSENQEWLDWVLRWIAYPLQHPGAKMRSSIVMHGDEGSGKNLFWESVVGKIYGEYSNVIGNRQLEAQYNEWASQKLFMVADEVVTRAELRQLKGNLRNLVTGETVNVNQKFMSERQEANHMNFVFLSNELQPLALDRTDRRYMVLWTPSKKDKSFYRDVGEEIRNGGIEAFYYYLLHEVDLTGFNEHTNPPMNTAKEELIELNLSSSERFFKQWMEGFLPLPVMTCTSDQLFSAYLRWTHLSGEKWQDTLTFFGKRVERIGREYNVKKHTVRVQVEDKEKTSRKQRVVYLVYPMPPGKTDIRRWVDDSSAVFDEALKKYRGVFESNSARES